jgi:hypothetical protein
MAMSDTETTAEIGCMPIWERFPKDIRRKVAALDWDGHRAVIRLHEIVPDFDGMDYSINVCPLGYAIYASGVGRDLWLAPGNPDEPAHFYGSGAPSPKFIALALMPNRDERTWTADDKTLYEKLWDEATQFVKPWDWGMIPVAKLPTVLCLDQGEATVAP